MLNPQQQSSGIDITSFFQSINPAINPNLNMYFPQPVLPSELRSSGPVLDPPATDPDCPSGSKISNYGGFEGQTPIYDDPNAGSRSWVVQQAEPSTDAIAINSLNEKSMVAPGLYNPGNNVLTNQPLVNDATKLIPLKTKVILSMRCEVCDIDCNSKDVYESHISGKKHKKKSEMHDNPTTTAFGASSADVGENLETKRQKLVEGGATVVFTRVCTMCNVFCSGQEMLDKHLAGKKHAAQARKHSQDGMDLSVAANPNYISGIDLTLLPQDHNTGPCESDPNKTSADQFAWCEVCNIYCNNNDVLVVHKSGKKHLKNLEKLRKIETDTNTPAPTNAPGRTVLITGPMEEVSQDGTDESKNENATESQAPREDSEMKKRKIMEFGADGMVLSVAANPDFVSGISPMIFPQDNKTGGCESDPNNISANKFAWCEVCNIYCTSIDVLIVHKLGKKHLKNVEKLKKETDINIRDSTDPPATAFPVLRSMKNPEASKGETEELNNENAESREDSGTKKRKIMGGGADGIEQPVAANPDSVCGISTTVLPQDNKNSACGSNLNQISTDQFARCEVCNIYCTGNDHLIVHKLGKKHLKNLEKLKNTETDTGSSASKNSPVLSISVIRPMDNPEANQGKSNDLKDQNAAESPALGEDLETKKRKIMEVGAAGDAVRVCTICNVVCNSQTVLDSHLAGKKHATMVRKQDAVIFIATAGSHFVAVT